MQLHVITAPGIRAFAGVLACALLLLLTGRPVMLAQDIVKGTIGTASVSVTHLVFVASSSANGALFVGGVNSTLVVDDLRLNY